MTTYKLQILCLLCSVSAAVCALSAAERTVWEGNKAISWNPEVYDGEQFETPNGTFTGLVKDDTIRVTVIAKIDDPQYVMTYKDGEQWTWTDLTDVTVAEGVMTYIVASEQMAQWIADRGLVFRGQGYDMTKIVVASEDKDPGPQPQPGGEYEDTEVWTGDVAISWNPEVYAGEQFDTYVLQQDMFAGIAKDDSIKVYYAQAINDAQFAASFKAGEDWTWTDLAIVEKDGFYSYRVADEQMAQWIADRGIVLRGQGYHATRIVVGKPKAAEGLDQIVNRKSSNRKFIKDGQVLIVRDGAIYTVLGQKIQ